MVPVDHLPQTASPQQSPAAHDRTFGKNSSQPGPTSAALSHHWLVRNRGGEKVLEALAELVPEAPIHTLVYDRHGMRDSPLSRRRIRDSWLRYLPGIQRHYPRLLPLLPEVAQRMRLPDVELVLCSDAAMAKAMVPHPRTKVVCYCHSPMRYAYDDDLFSEYRDSVPRLLRPFFTAAVARARSVDQRAAKRIDVFVANSAHVARRIEHAYGRVAQVVHPPVDLPQGPTMTSRADYYLSVGFQTPYKRLDLAVEACARLGRRLVVIGSGPDAEKLRRNPPAHVEVLGWQPDKIVRRHFRQARGLVFPGEEDFGIVPVEAFAHGCPVIAYGKGGATESVKPGICGLWFGKQNADDIVHTILESEATDFDPREMHREAQAFSRERFLAQMKAIVDQTLAGELHA